MESKLTEISDFVEATKSDIGDMVLSNLENKAKAALLFFRDTETESIPIEVKMAANIFGCYENGGNVLMSLNLATAWIKNPLLSESIKGGDYMDEKHGECPFCGESKFVKFDSYPEMKDINHLDNCEWKVSIQNNNG